MPNKNSTLKTQPNNTLTLRKSPRLHLKNQSPTLNPITPEPRLRSCRFVSPLSSLDKGIVKKGLKNIEKSKKIEITTSGSSNLEKLNNGFVKKGLKNIGKPTFGSSNLAIKNNGFAKKGLKKIEKSTFGSSNLEKLNNGFVTNDSKNNEESTIWSSNLGKLNNGFVKNGSKNIEKSIFGSTNLGKLNNGFVKNDSLKIKKSTFGSTNLGKMNNGFVNNVENSTFGSSNFEELNNGLSSMEKTDFCVRRSPRYCDRANVVDELLEKKGFSEKKRRGVSYLGKMEVGFDLSKQDEGKGENNKRVLRSSNRKKADESSKKSSLYTKGYLDAARDVLASDSGKQVEDKKRVTRSSVRENADDILEKMNFYEKGSPVAVGLDFGKEMEGKSVIAKRVTRSSFKAKTDEIAVKGDKCGKGLSDVKGAANREFDLGKKAGSGIKIEKKVTRGSTRGNADEMNNKNTRTRKDLFDTEEELLEAKSCDFIRGKIENHADESSENVDEERDIVKNKQTIGVKRKRNQDGESHGWTTDQELALQRAYFAAKPTPHFWKRVSKLVPGKSAQDCFNKINSDHLTPPQLRTRSRATNKNVTPIEFSASKLLKPEGTKVGKITCRKQKGHLAQKTVRNILQKHYNVDQNYEADLFSVLESTFSSSTKSPECGVSYSTPQGEKNRCGFLKVCNDKSSSGLKKRFSRLSGSKEESLVSPPVLKPVKNKALLEKYIDQLHCRDAKRRVACRKMNCKKNITQKTEPIKLLKDALVLDAKDFVHKFQNRMCSAKREYSNDDDDEDDEENDDFEEDYEEDYF